MNCSQVIESYYNDESIITFFKNIAGEWWDELRQDVFVALCEYDESRIIEMHQKKYLKFFTIRIALNQFRSKHSKFYYQNFKNNNSSLALTDDDSIEVADSYLFKAQAYDLQEDAEWVKREEMHHFAQSEMENLRYFEKEILKLYLHLGTYKKVSQETGIPIRSVAFGVKNAILNIKSKIKYDE